MRAKKEYYRNRNRAHRNPAKHPAAGKVAVVCPEPLAGSPTTLGWIELHIDGRELRFSHEKCQGTPGVHTGVVVATAIVASVHRFVPQSLTISLTTPQMGEPSVRRPKT